MTRNRSKLLQAAIALVLLIMSTVLLWPSLGTSAAYASCNPPSSDACITNSPASTLTLNGTNQILYYKLDFSVNSPNTTTWHVTISSSRFATTAAPGTPTRTLSPDASRATAVATTSACMPNCPVNQITYPVVMPAGTPVTFFDNKNSNKGNGTFNIEATIGVLVPGNAYKGTYTCTLTIAFQSGP